MVRELTFMQFCIELFKNGTVGLILYLFVFFSGKMKRPLLSLLGNISVMGVLATLIYFMTKDDAGTAVGMIFVALFVIVCCSGSIKEKILLYVIFYIADSITLMLSFFFLSAFNFGSENLYALATFALNFAIAAPIAYIVGKIWRSIKITGESGILKGFFLLPLSQFAMCFIVTFYLSRTPEAGMDKAFELSGDIIIVAVFLAVLIISLVADAMLLNSFVKTAASIAERERLQALEYENEHIYEYVKNLEGYVVEMRRYRHDMLNTFSTMRYSLSNGEEGVSDTLKLIDDTEIDIKNLKVYHYCECNFVNCILAHEESKASEAGVACVINAGVPEKLEVSEIDLCRVLTNLMDNAIKYCKNLETQDEKTVYTDLKIVDGYLYIVVGNPKKEGKIYFETDNPDKLDHGLGMGIIEKLAQKHEGVLITDDSGDKMTITVTMKWA